MDSGKDGRPLLASLPLADEDDCEVLDVELPLEPDPEGLTLDDESPPPQEPSRNIVRPAASKRLFIVF